MHNTFIGDSSENSNTDVEGLESGRIVVKGIGA